MKSYSELIKLNSYYERLEYLKILDNNVASPRHMSHYFYKSQTWLSLRQQIIDRDCGFDLGVFGVYITGPILVHHINPITEFDIIRQTKKLTDPENLISSSYKTHDLVHYNKQENEPWIERTPGDTKLW